MQPAPVRVLSWLGRLVGSKKNLLPSLTGLEGHGLSAEDITLLRFFGDEPADFASGLDAATGLDAAKRSLRDTQLQEWRGENRERL